MTPTIQAVMANVMIAVDDRDPYVWGGISLYTGADCSGLLYESLLKAGSTNEARTSQAQFAAWKVAPGPGYGIAVFFNVPGDGPPQPQHVGICVTDTTMAEEPHTGLDAEIVAIPNIPGVESVMGYRYLPVTYAPPPAPPAPEPPVAVPPAPPTNTSTNPQEITMGLPSSCTDQGAVRCQIREWWTTYRSDPMTAADQNLLQLCFDPATAGGFGGNPDLMLANIIDGAKTAGTLRPQFVNAV